MKKASFLITPISIGALLSSLLFIFFLFDDKGPDFELTHPEIASEPIKIDVMQAYKLMMNTKRMHPDNVGDKLTCSNCHFKGGGDSSDRHCYHLHPCQYTHKHTRAIRWSDCRCLCLYL